MSSRQRVQSTIAGLDEDGVQHTILVTSDGKTITRITGVDEDEIQRTVLLKSDGTLITEDLGTHTNPEQWLQDNAWEAEEVTIALAGAPGEQALGVAVAAGKKRRITELTIRNAGTNNTVVTLLIAGGNTKLTIDVPASSTREWESVIGRIFDAAEIPAVQTSDITGGSTFISASGVEA